MSSTKDLRLEDTPYIAVLSGQTVVVEDVDAQSGALSRNFTEGLKRLGLRNYLLTPLYHQGAIVGIFELASKVPAAVTGLTLFKINRMKPIFADAVRRHADEFESRVKAAMLEQFTAIHPTIQWKFREAAIHVLEGRNVDEVGQQIILHNLYPFYGSLDIRGSSRIRNQSIRWDLKDNLAAARDLLEEAFNDLQLVILKELIMQVDGHLSGIGSGRADEQVVAQFIREQINPVIEHLAQHHDHIRTLAASFGQPRGPGSAIYTTHRRAYEQALALVNQHMMEFISRQEAALSLQMPCYFDKYKTDGVEYNIYTGIEISPDFPFDPLYLENLQLEQLLWTCQIVREVERLQPQVEEILCSERTAEAHREFPDGARLLIAPLILVYSDPITLRFRMDEKRLDVEGTYNMRYEIVKKRIDKARIAGTGERLTQPGHVAIVYGRPDEARSCERHLAYLAEMGQIEADWEHLELDHLQDVEGLKALRIQVRSEV